MQFVNCEVRKNRSTLYEKKFIMKPPDKLTGLKISTILQTNITNESIM